MAIEKEIIIKGDSTDAVKSIQDVDDAIKKTDKSVDKLGDSTKSSLDKTKKGASGAAKGFKAIGTAFKAIGIGIVVALFAKLAEILGKNQKVMDVFSNVMTSLEIAFNDLFSFVSDNFMPAFEGMKKFFSELTFKSVGDGIKKNIIERFESALEVLGFLRKAFNKFKEGKFSEAFDEIKNAGKEMVDVLTGVDNVVDKVTDVVIKGADAITGYAKNTFEAAAAITAASKAALIGAAVQAQLVEKFDIAAEKQRQIRDAENKSIKERKIANDELGKVLEKQEKAMLRQADLQITAARNAFNLNKSDENRIALIDSQTNKIGILAQIEGFRSEQIVNRIALQKEEIELNNSISDSEKERQIAQLAFEEEQEENAVLKLEKQRERLDEENEIISEDLERKRELFQEGTQARIDAEQEFLTRKQEIDNQILANEKSASEEKKVVAQLEADAKIEIANQVFNLVGLLAKKGSKLAKGAAAAQTLMNTYQGVTSALAAVSTIPEPFGTALKFANAAVIGVSGLLNVKKILGTDETGQSLSSGKADIPNGGGQNAPSFNLVQGTQGNQIASNIAGQNAQPQEVFVVSSKVTSAQELDRNAVDNAAL
jgi:hypothetical protein